MSLKCAYFAFLMILESWLPALHPPLNFGTPPPFYHKTFAQVIPPISIVPPTQLHPQQHKTIFNHHDPTRPSTLHAHTYRGPQYGCRYRRTSSASISDRLYRIPLHSGPRRTRGRFMFNGPQMGSRNLAQRRETTKTDYTLLT